MLELSPFPYQQKAHQPNSCRSQPTPIDKTRNEKNKCLWLILAAKWQKESSFIAQLGQQSDEKQNRGSRERFTDEAWAAAQPEEKTSETVQPAQGRRRRSGKPGRKGPTRTAVPTTLLLLYDINAKLI